MKAELKILDSTDIQLNQPAFTFLDRIFRFQKEIYIKSKFGSKRKKQIVRILDSTKNSDGSYSYFMPTGLYEEAIHALKTGEMPYEVKGKLEKLPYEQPELRNINFREDQERMVFSALDKQRGVLVAPTGTGKTILALGIISALPKDCKILFVAHTKDLIYQFKNECEKLNYKAGLVQGQTREFNKPIVCATIQTLDKYKPEEISDMFDCVLIDEAHYVSSFTGRYAKLLNNSLAPMKIGFTATPHKDGEGLWAGKSFLGSIVDELTVKEGNKKNLLAIPTVKFITLPKLSSSSIYQYRDFYDTFITKNTQRNNTIIDLAKEHTRLGESVLIFVKQIEHGEILEKLAKKKKLNTKFYNGSTENETRKLILEELKSKEKLCAISTAIWREGINVPVLNAIINGVGGKSEIGTIQYVGRGTRLDEQSGKKSVIIYDFADPYKYLAEHYTERQSLFIEQGWSVLIRNPKQALKEISKPKKKVLKRKKK